MDIRFWRRQHKEEKDFTLSLQDFIELARYNGTEIIKNSTEAIERSSWVYSAVRAITTKISTVEWGIYRNNKHVNKAEFYIKHPTSDRQYTTTQLLQVIQSWLELRGNAYLYVEFPDIKILDNDFLFKEGDDFTYYPNGKRIVLDKEKMVVIQNYSPYMRDVALPTLTASMSGIELQSIVEITTRNLFQNGAILPLVLLRHRKLTPEQLQDLRRQWRERYSGYQQAGSVPILPEGIEPKTIGLSFSDAAVLTFEKLTKNRISTVFGVPPLYMNDLDNTKYDSAPAQERVFVRNSIIPRLIMLQEQLTLKLLPLLGFEDAEFKFHWENLPELREDEEKRAAVDTQLVQSGILTINEVRKARGLEPVPWGDVWYAPMNLIPTGKSVEVPAKKHITRAINTDLIWNMFVTRISPQENKFKKELAKLFAKQEKEIQENLAKYAGKSWTTDIIKVIWDTVKWEKLFANMEKPYIVAFMHQAGKATLEQLGAVGIDFNLDNPEVREWIDKKAMKFAKDVNKTTLQQLKNELKKGHKLGEGIGELSERVAKVFNFAKGYRTERIARTEVVGCNNKANVEAGKMAGMGHKVWITALDERTREWHAEANGQTVGINEYFVVGGEYMEFPGDPNASASNVINCRCTITFEP